MRATAGLALVAAASSACQPAPPPVDIPADRPILAYTGTTAQEADAALMPQGFTEPDPTVCATDPTRQYLGELFRHGFTDNQVLWHWAPVVPGPDPSHPTLDQPEWSLSGDVVWAGDSYDDVMADHPFGLDTNFDVQPDADFAFFPYEADREGALHCEIEQRIFPRSDLGFSPAEGQRVLLRGVWVLDCGHPPYGAEMHPPTFMTFAHAEDAVTTDATVYVAPYRSSLLFDPDSGLADAFADSSRFQASDTLPFENAMIAAIYRAVNGDMDRLQTPALMVANHFDPIDFLVCAPLPRPDGAKLDAQWNLVARTGVDLVVSRYPDSGCVQVQASMTSDYAPMPLPYATADWPWDELGASASEQAGQPIDVRQQISDAVDSLGYDASSIPALQEDHPPIIDSYAALHTEPGADQVSGRHVHDAADDQPFPLYGQVRVAWKTK